MHRYQVSDQVIIKGAVEVPVLEIKELIPSLDESPLYKCGLPGRQYPINILVTLAENQLQPLDKNKTLPEQDIV